MLIDWFTVGAQLINFLILVWLMKRFLYRPILHAIDAREKAIAKKLSDADAKKAEAKTEREDFQKKNDDFDKQRDALMEKAKEDAKTAGQKILDKATQDADELSKKRQEKLVRDAQKLNQTLGLRTQEEVFAIARKALTDLATADLDEQICAVAIDRLNTMNDKTKAAFIAVLKTKAEPILVQSAFDLSKKQHAAIEKALHETFSSKNPIQFETAANVIGGLEITVHGQKIGWSISSYLTAMEKNMDAFLGAVPELAYKTGTK